MTEKFQHSIIDRFLIQFDQALRTCVPGSIEPKRKSPATSVDEKELSTTEKQHAAGLMRINHTGEVCAQALYLGQATTARLGQIRKSMELAAEEEKDHLAWCEQRLGELDSHTSALNPLWYLLSFSMGATAGITGDRWSLGFVAETEKQVCEHLEDHLSKLPEQDIKSRAILEQMISDEKQHEQTARQAGGFELPIAIRQTMTLISEFMKKTTYHI
ncbi:MAG: 2-polyprenyl-3-methyl-6-methoxy-1,4-benzoquinone monooxygenase [Pseudomonadota bacterium]|jgi:ubiquinone biosynthesis monooxygenase Coq7|nr:2-polyprenyl-3-methyl-6-methoxy-1,4-benzoquinone monooxygenase [Pseudomonadota bacterium]HBX99926.1 demethoxyubiquinone hydroxylase family protein [Gammaproteobacteria bacterium]MEC8949644.1 2-polyprenyl-3-methyl-6-methoxy-1,4-benzoquinone monooxygenase [Pseudomonadota bacterium]MEC9218090.1 2-polyprenyl-3-methyl-6-methoxy-1,4-benzoquinone monooxygenase [Pseudomonadota bacterium]MEC9299975.1 2-polyprenyl-3-methyl-6-methoxy-1,4-benzoquinone monooxygenase [Pseudomonadota bacterium]|tara:strand:+ start:8825 stop:9472 length:648 start_codon:yes stop_codon:yes gene_type:complete